MSSACQIFGHRVHWIQNSALYSLVPLTTMRPAIFALVFLLAAAFAVRPHLTLISSNLPQTLPGSELCGPCVNFMDQAVNALLQIIASILSHFPSLLKWTHLLLDGGVIEKCSDLCSKLPNKLEDSVCEALCSGVGIDVFMHLVEVCSLCSCKWSYDSFFM